MNRDDRENALVLVPVSRETEERFDIFVELLARWRKKTNLISDATFAWVWTRHIADSAQIRLIHPRAVKWLDIGSGAGFPGIVLAIQLSSIPGTEVHCVESDQRKCAFLREAARATCAPAIIHPVRVQSLTVSALGAMDGITARAFAPLSNTLAIVGVWLQAGAVGVFPRGRTVAEQLEHACPDANYAIEIVPSIVEPSASLLKVRIR